MLNRDFEFFLRRKTTNFIFNSPISRWFLSLNCSFKVSSSMNLSVFSWTFLLQTFSHQSTMVDIEIVTHTLDSNPEVGAIVQEVTHCSNTINFPPHSSSIRAYLPSLIKLCIPYIWLVMVFTRCWTSLHGDFSFNYPQSGRVLDINGKGLMWYGIIYMPQKHFLMAVKSTGGTKIFICNEI